MSIDLTRVKFDEQGIIFPNGSRWDLELNEHGEPDLMLNGKPLHPWGGLEPEGSLEAEDFVCVSGKLVAVRVPPPKPSGKRKRRLAGQRKFYYVRRKYMRNLHPIECYNDIADDTSNFMLCPPTDGESPEFRLIMRRAKSLRRNDGWTDQRMFLLPGRRHPCTNQPPEWFELDEEEKAERQEELVARSGAEHIGAGGVELVFEKAAETPATTTATTTGPAVFEAEDEDDGLPSGVGKAMFSSARKPGPLAEDALRELLISSWKPTDWPAAALPAAAQPAE